MYYVLRMFNILPQLQQDLVLRSVGMDRDHDYVYNQKQIQRLHEDESVI